MEYLPLITPNILAQTISICLNPSTVKSFQLDSDLCLADWRYVLEMLSFSGVSVDREVDRINSRLLGSGLTISLNSLEETRHCLSMLDSFACESDYLSKFEAELNSVIAISKNNN